MILSTDFVYGVVTHTNWLKINQIQRHNSYKCECKITLTAFDGNDAW